MSSSIWSQTSSMYYIREPLPPLTSLALRLLGRKPTKAAYNYYRPLHQANVKTSKGVVVSTFLYILQVSSSSICLQTSSICHIPPLLLLTSLAFQLYRRKPTKTYNYCPPHQAKTKTSKGVVANTFLYILVSSSICLQTSSICRVLPLLLL